MTYSRRKFFLSFLIAICLPAFAWGRNSPMSGVLVTTNIFVYNQTLENQNGSQSDNNHSIYDLQAGYLNAEALYLGLAYSFRDTSQSGATALAGRAVGASAGYLGDSGFYLMGHYYFWGNYGDYKEASGYQVDVGFLAGVTGALFLGAEINYRGVEYKNNTNVAIQNITLKELLPMLTIAFIF